MYRIYYIVLNCILYLCIYAYNMQICFIKVDILIYKYYVFMYIYNEALFYDLRSIILLVNIRYPCNIIMAYKLI